MRLSILLLLACTTAACADPVETLTAARAELEAARARFESADEVRRSAVTAAEAALPRLGSDDARPPCPISEALTLEEPYLGSVPAIDLSDAYGPRLAAFDTERVVLMSELLLVDRPSNAAARSLADRVAAVVQPWPRDATWVPASRTEPRFTEEGVYHAGYAEGALIVWNYETLSVECSGRFAATNSPDVLTAVRADSALQQRFDADPVGYLQADLRERALEAALAALRAEQ